MGNMSRWLDVEVGTDDVELNTLPSNVAFADLQCDNEVKLLVGDLGRGDEGPKLKVFRGAMQMCEVTLPDIPLGVEALPAGEGGRAPPLVAIAFSSAIFFYRNLKVVHKYYLPKVEVTMGELEVWKQLSDPENHTAESVARLAEVLSGILQAILSAEALTFLSLSAAQRLELVEQGGARRAASGVMPNSTHVVAVTTLKMSSVERHAVCALVVATEDGDVIILETHNFTPLTQAKVCSTKKTPFQMVATGLYNVDYRITVATREKCICVLRRGSTVGRTAVTLPEHVVCVEVVPTDGTIVVLTADNILASYTRKGRRQWQVSLPHRGISLCAVAVQSAALWLCAVSLAAGTVHLYDTSATLRDSFSVTDVGSVLKFGQLGHEENVFTIVTAGGNLMLKILKRTAEFNDDEGGFVDGGGVRGAGAGAGAVGPPWSIPKRSRLLIQQTHREREHHTAMAGALHAELCRLRVCAARELLSQHGAAHQAVADGAHIALSAEVCGLGPKFLVRVRVRNTSATATLRGLALLFHVHDSSYVVSHPYIAVPVVCAGGSVEVPAIVEEVFPEGAGAEVLLRAAGGAAGEVRVLALRGRPGDAGALAVAVAARLAMPLTVPALLPAAVLTAAHTFTQHDIEPPNTPSHAS